MLIRTREALYIYILSEFQTPSTFLTLSQFIRYSLEINNKILEELKVLRSVDI